MPCVVMKAEDVGITGYEDRDSLDANAELKAKIEAIRMAVGERMKHADNPPQSELYQRFIASAKAIQMWGECGTAET